MTGSDPYMQVRGGAVLMEEAIPISLTGNHDRDSRTRSGYNGTHEKSRT